MDGPSSRLVQWPVSRCRCKISKPTTENLEAETRAALRPPFQLLLKSGADPNVKDIRRQDTALHTALSAYQDEIAESITFSGGNKNSRNNRKIQIYYHTFDKTTGKPKEVCEPEIINPKPSTQNPQPQNQVSAEERGSSRAESRRGTCDSAIAWMITAFNSIRVASRVDWDNMWMAGAGYW